ncbi:MAG: T9SS type A sorting domain-containing protein, partial [bacterium]
TIIEFALPEASQVRLEIFNILGQSVEVLVDERLSAGIHQVTYEASNNPSGVYFYRLTHNDGVETKKMTLLK